uniref:HTH psq-type domain-containing protein n=1 Tax=Panagrolaimus superbus TaxID=310955 RepID=A0A914YT57_9BILA
MLASSDDLSAQVKLFESLSNFQASTNNFESSREEGKRGRKSKYCDAATKVDITNYAKQFGPSAAARKFNIPTAVASYYYRKANSPKLLSMKSLSSEIESPKINTADDQIMSQSVSQVPSSSPNTFLRGRGRGRPKLIGDELDAALVDYIVETKKQNPQKHYTAGTIMDLSKDYIKRSAPGLLVEDGGSVNLKNTWAIKLLMRVAEREHELATNSNEVFNRMLIDFFNTAFD